MLATAPETKINAMDCFTQAVHMVQNRNRANPRMYEKILFPLMDSFTAAQKAAESGKPRPNAGGPAMRLAQAVWDLDYRLRFPTEATLIAAEEDSTGHFYHYYRDMAAGPYYISRAADAFRTLRQKVLTLPDMPKATQPAANVTSTNLCHALLAMDDTLYRGEGKALANTPFLKRLTHAANTAHPEPDTIVVAFASAVKAYTLMRATPNDFNRYLAARSHYDPLRALQYEHSIQLQGWDKTLNSAINALCEQIRPISPP